jgi:hypothetical protein
MSTENKLYTVQSGHSVRSGGKSHRGDAGTDSVVSLNAADAKRLMDAGVVLPAGKDALDPSVAPAPGILGARSEATAAASTFDAAGILGGTVAEVSEQLGTMTPDQLEQLRAGELEKADKARKGVLEAIDAELAKNQQ